MSSLISGSCNGCVFSIRENDTQSGCKLNRLGPLKAELTDGWYWPKRFCNTYRMQDWLKERTVEDGMVAARKEVRPTFDVCVIYSPNTDLRKTLHSIKDQDYPVRNVIVFTTDSTPQIMIDLIEVLRPHIKYSCCYSSEQNMEELVDQHLFNSKPRPQYYYFIGSGQELPWNILQELDCYINDDLDQIIGCVGSDTHFIIQSSLYWRLQVKHFREIVSVMQKLNSELVRAFDLTTVQ